MWPLFDTVVVVGGVGGVGACGVGNLVGARGVGFEGRGVGFVGANNCVFIGGVCALFVTAAPCTLFTPTHTYEHSHIATVNHGV